MSFKQVLLDGLPIPVWGVDWDKEKPDVEAPLDTDGKGIDHIDLCADAVTRLAATRIVWARLSPPKVNPGKIAEFTCKLASPMLRPVKVEFSSHAEEIIEVVIRPLPQPMVISAITFSNKLDTIYVYMMNNSDRPVSVYGVELNGKMAPKGIWFTSQILQEGSKHLAVLNLEKPLARGECITVKVCCEGGVASEERTRAFAGFPINVEEGTPPTGFGLDPEPFAHRPAYLESTHPPEPQGLAPEDVLRGNFIFSCAMHTYSGDRMRSAREMLRRYDLCRRFEPSVPCYHHLCRVGPEMGYALFGEIADAFATNPNITTGVSQQDRTDSANHIVGRTARYASLGARPRPVYMVLQSTPFGKTVGFCAAKELYDRAYTIIGNGAKGVLYRHHAWAENDPAVILLNNAIKRINERLRLVRGYLAIADPVPWVRTDVRDTAAEYMLLAGDMALVLVRVDKALEERSAPKSGPHQVEFGVPASISLGRAFAVTDKGLEPVGDADLRRSNGRYVLRFPSSNEPDIFVVTIRRATR